MLWIIVDEGPLANMKIKRNSVVMLGSLQPDAGSISTFNIGLQKAQIWAVLWQLVECRHSPADCKRKLPTQSFVPFSAYSGQDVTKDGG